MASQALSSTGPGRSMVIGEGAGSVARVLLVDDSTVVRSVVERILVGRPQFRIAASLPSAVEAIEYLRREKVDVIILDIEMPDRSGLDALPDILALAGSAKVLILSSLAEEGGAVAIRALALGACDTLAKPGRSSFAGQFANVLLGKLSELAWPGGKLPGSYGASPIAPRAHTSSSRLQCIGIGASTGGIHAMYELLQRLDPRITAPILITQHLPDNFIPFLVRQLDDLTARKAVLAEDGVPLQPNHIYVAPGHAHLTCVEQHKRPKIRLVQQETAARYTPSVDPMLESMASCFGPGGVAVILSGMGRDGLLGAEFMADKGCSIYVQDPASCVVWGMPGVVAQAGLATAVLCPTDIADFIAESWIEN